MADNLFDPAVLKMPFANNGDKNQIPDTPTGSNLASLPEGFPPKTGQLPSEGGEPPERKDFNGVMNLNSQFYFFNQNGGLYTFRQDVSDAIGGYPEKAALWYNSPDGLTLLRSTKPNNTDNFVTDPSVIGTSWTREIPTIAAVQLLLASKADINLVNTGMLTDCILSAPNGVLTSEYSSQYHDLEENINGTWGAFSEVGTGISANQVRGPQKTLDFTQPWQLKTRFIWPSYSADIMIYDSQNKLRFNFSGSRALDGDKIVFAISNIIIYISNVNTITLPLIKVPKNSQGIYDVVVAWDGSTYSVTVTGIDGQTDNKTVSNTTPLYVSGDVYLIWGGASVSSNASVQYGDNYTNLALAAGNYLSYGYGAALTVKSGVVGLASDGRDEATGLLKSVQYTTSADITESSVPTAEKMYSVFLGTDGLIRFYANDEYYKQDTTPADTAGLWYSPSNNLYREYINNAWTVVNLFWVGSYWTADNAISRIQSAAPISLSGNARNDLSNVTTVNKDFRDLSVSWCMPGKNYIELPLGVSGTHYTAPANGYFCLCFLNAIYAQLYNNSTPGIFWGIDSSQSGVQGGFIPCKKGDDISYYYQMTTPRWVRFVYAEGEAI